MFLDDLLFNDFLEIQRKLKPALSIEVGAYDAQFSRYMVAVTPEIYAFEANPLVYARYKDMPRVNYQNLAISDVSGFVDFEIQTDAGELASNNSIMNRNDNTPKRYVKVPSRTLNELFAGRKRIALWIDCEGASQQVLTGADKVLPNVDSIFIEVERQEFWKNQWLEDDVRSYLNDFGFVMISSRDQYVNQANQIYVRKEYIMPTPQGDITSSEILTSLTPEEEAQPEEGKENEE